MQVQEIFQSIGEDLAEVEATLLHEGTRSRVSLLTDVGEHILSGGGKRFRPALTLLCGRLCGTPADKRIPMAACVELIHNATLLHDDIIDEGVMRRGKAAAHLLWGDTAGVLAANLHFSRAYALVLKAGGMECLDVLNRTVHTIVEGELQQFLRVGFADMDEDRYREIILRKTAKLISTACRLGAMPGPGRGLAESLASFGLDLGMAFQMMDDLLDYTAQEDKLGKKVGTDFREAKLTLPLIVALSRCAGPERQDLLNILGRTAEERSSLFPWAKALIERHGGFETTFHCAKEHMEKAIEALSAIPRSSDRDALADLARFVVERNY